MRVYIETTALEPENEDSLASWSSGLALDLRRGKHVPILYGLVQREVQHSSQSARDLCECLQNDIQISTIGREARQLAAAFQKRNLLPQREAARRMHVALATVETADALATQDEMLLSSEEMFAQAARELGYRPVPFRTPKMLASRKA